VATVPVTRTWVAGEVVTAAYMNNNITAVLGWLLAPAICQVRQIVSQNLTSGSFATLTYTAEDVDTTGMHSTLSNTDRITSVYPGWYGVAGSLGISGNVNGRRGGNWRVNTTDVNGSAILVPSSSAAPVIPLATMMIFLNVGDYLQMAAFQDSGTSPLATSVTTYNQSRASAWWISN
jgi:hypothetical protein